MHHLADFDDEALRTFLAAGDGDIAPERLGTALQGDQFDDLAQRVARILPDATRAWFEEARRWRGPPAPLARRRPPGPRTPFWAALYSHHPHAHEGAVAGGDH